MSAKQDAGEFDPSTCKNIPLGIEEYQALDPSAKQKPIKCSDLERCAALLDKLRRIFLVNEVKQNDNNFVISHCIIHFNDSVSR
ncbi:MAG TPA: hypothetical protein VI727_10615 [Candidatus Brocadiaceae bacterium]|nr:hypothetical protein [Candidatus Brocadiaceae bacterium]